MKQLFTSESVTEGHPDKLCDYIADSILDEYLKQDPKSRVACECIASKNLIVIVGEITSKANIDIEKTARNAIKEVGYTDESCGIDYKTCKIIFFHLNQLLIYFLFGRSKPRPYTKICFANFVLFTLYGQGWNPAPYISIK